jgi:geranylgeranyl diphosphate synthase type I
MSLVEKLRRNAERIDTYIMGLLEGEPPILYEASRHLLKAGGKRLRPYLVVKSCEIVGGDIERAIPFAAAVEMLHNFTLIHDDIMDRDEKRRGVPTVHVKYGLPLALASGDLLFAKVYEAMTQVEGVPAQRVLRCVRRATMAAIHICEGQILDVSYPKLSGVSEEDYYRMVGGKTASLFEACAEIGALVGGAPEEEVELLKGYGYNAGIAFQLIDDILGITADEKTLGKPVGSDLREGKKTLIIIDALKRASKQERSIIEAVLGVEDAPPEEVHRAIETVRRLGSIEYARRKAERYVEEAKRRLRPFPDCEARRDLEELVDFFISRTF